MQNNFKMKKKLSKKCIYFSSLFYSYMVFGSVANNFRCAFLSAILRKNSSNFADATREKGFTAMTPLDMSRAIDYDVITASQIASSSS